MKILNLFQKDADGVLQPTPPAHLEPTDPNSYESEIMAEIEKLIQSPADARMFDPSQAFERFKAVVIQ